MKINDNSISCVLVGFWQILGENRGKNLILAIIIANCDFLINPLGPISDLEVNLSKYDVFSGGRNTHGRKIPTREHARIRNI